MNSPFTDFMDTATEAYPETRSQRDELSELSPFSGLTQFTNPTDSNETEMEGELSTSELGSAMAVNAAYMVSLGWANHLDLIIDKLAGVTAIYARDIFTRDIKYDQLARAIDRYQIMKSIVTANKGVIEISTWSMLQGDLGFINYDKLLKIDIKKAVAANKILKQQIWGKHIPFILKYFKGLGYLKYDLPLDDKYFALVVATWQSRDPKIKNVAKDIDGILGKYSWDILRTELESQFPQYEVKAHVKLKDTAEAAKRFVAVMEILGSKLRDNLTAIESKMDAMILNEKGDSSMVREGIYVAADALLDIAGEAGPVGAFASVLGKIALGMVKKHYEEKEENARKDANLAISSSLTDIILAAKTATYNLTGETVFKHEFDDTITSIRRQYQSNPKEGEKQVIAEFERFLNYLIALEETVRNDRKIFQIAISSIMNLMSAHTRIIIHCQNSENSIEDWTQEDINNIIQDPKRDRVFLQFNNVHPQISSPYDLITPIKHKILKNLWGIWKDLNYPLRELYLDKDVFLRVNFFEEVGNILVHATIPRSYSVYINTIKKAETSWKRSTDLLGRFNTTIRFYYGYALKTKGMNEANNKNITYSNIILTIVNAVMSNEYNSQNTSKQVGYLETETESGETTQEYDTLEAGELENYQDEDEATYSEASVYETPATSEEEEIEYDVPTPTPAKTPTPVAPVGSPISDLSIAVSPFDPAQKQMIEPGLLTPVRNKKAINWNTAFLKKISVDPLHIITDLQRYIDLNGVRLAITAYNKANPSVMISPGTAPIDAVFAEAVHQFQRKIYFDSSLTDGKSGPGTLHSLGIISFPQDPKKLAVNNAAKKELKKINIKVNINGTECNSENWFNFTYNPSFLGISFNRSVHYLLIKQLRIAESFLLNSPRFKGNNLVSMGVKLGLSKDTEQHAGGRFSGVGMHTFGLAIDIDHNNNPWIGAGWVKKPKTEIYDKLSEPKRKRLDSVLNEKRRILEVFKKASGQKLFGEKITVYLDHVGEIRGADTKDVYKELKQRNDEFKKYLQTDPPELSYWQKSATFEHGKASNGFLNLDPDLVYALRQIGNLAWGAVDFGPGEGADGDIMHFDTRSIGIGRTINLNKTVPGGDPIRTHPYLRKDVLKSKETSYENESDEFYISDEDFEKMDESESTDSEFDSENSGNMENINESESEEGFDEAYEGEIYEAYEEENDEAMGEAEKDVMGQESETQTMEETVSEEAEVSFENEYTVDAKFGLSGYLTTSAVKNRSIKTGVFIPAGYNQGGKVDLILYLHGLFENGSRKYGMAYYWKNYSNIREHFYTGGRNAILIAPALGSNPQVSDLHFCYQNGLDLFINSCIKELISRKILTEGTVANRIIIAAHSAGGNPMSAIMRNQNGLKANIDECWCFDCFYNYQWEKVLEKNGDKPFYHYWAFDSYGKTSRPGMRAGELEKRFKNLKNIQPAKGIHHRDVIEYAWRNEINKRPWFTQISNGKAPVVHETAGLSGELESTPSTFEQYFNEETLSTPSTSVRSGGIRAYLTLTATKQGQIKGSVTQKGKEGSIAVLQFHHEMFSPRDPASGLPAGRRQRKPIIITKEIDIASVKLLSAFTTNEILKQVIINFFKYDVTAKEINYYRITLTNATIASIMQDIPNYNEQASTKNPVIEKLELTYQTIEWRWLEKTQESSLDDWGTQK